MRPALDDGDGATLGEDLHNLGREGDVSPIVSLRRLVVDPDAGSAIGQSGTDRQDTGVEVEMLETYRKEFASSTADGREPDQHREELVVVRSSPFQRVADLGCSEAHGAVGRRTRGRLASLAALALSHPWRLALSSTLDTVDAQRDRPWPEALRFPVGVDPSTSRQSSGPSGRSRIRPPPGNRVAHNGGTPIDRFHGGALGP